MSISYCISVCTEDIELNNLLNQLLPNLDDSDEVIILVDVPKVTTEVGKVIASYRSIYPHLKIVEGSLNNDFANFKNEFVKNSSKEWILQLDADELLSEDLLTNLKPILEFNPEIDMFSIPRENYIHSLTQEWIQKWGWNVDGRGRINYPDNQQRLFRNGKNIKWQNKVHEILVGYKTYTSLPENYYLYHSKSLEKQIKQNEFYSKI